MVPEGYASIMAGRHGGYGKKLRIHFLSDTQKAERENWKGAEALISQRPLLMITLPSKVPSPKLHHQVQTMFSNI